MTDWKIPVIDIGPFGDGDAVTRERIVADVDWACRHIGFSLIANHGAHPNFDTRCACLSTCQGSGNLAKYAPIMAGEHMREKLLRRVEASP